MALMWKYHKKKLLLSVIFILIFSVVNTDCSVTDKLHSNKYESHPSSNETGITKSEKSGDLSYSIAPSAVIPSQSSSSSSGNFIDSIDYNQYINKVWVIKDHYNDFVTYPSFCISKIANGQITGRFNFIVGITNNESNHGHLTGTISKDTAICQFDDDDGVKGTMNLVFKTNNEIEVTIEFSDKSQADTFKVKGETKYQYVPFNINNMPSFVPIEDESFMVDLNSWGSVKFVSGIDTGEKMKPVVFYLTDKNGNVLYEFYVGFSTYADVGAVSFQDVNKDGLKDIIIILNGKNPDDVYGRYKATINFQNADGSFTHDSNLDKEINDSGNNKDIKTVTEYLSKKF